MDDHGTFFAHITCWTWSSLTGDSSTSHVQSSLRTGLLPWSSDIWARKWWATAGHVASWTCAWQSKISQAELETDLSGQEGMSCLGLGGKMLVDGVTRTKTTAGCETPRVPGFWLNPHSLSFPVHTVHTYFLSYLLHCTRYCTVTSMRISVFLLRVDADILWYVHVFSLSLVPPSPEELRLPRSHSEQVNQTETDSTDET